MLTIADAAAQPVVGEIEYAAGGITSLVTPGPLQNTWRPCPVPDRIPPKILSFGAMPVSFWLLPVSFWLVPVAARGGAALP